MPENSRDASGEHVDIDLLRDVLETSPEPSRDAEERLSLEGVARLVGAAMDMATVDLWTYMPEADAVVCRASWSRDPADQAAGDCRGVRLELAQSQDLRRVVLAGETVERHIDDADLPSAEVAALWARGYRSRMDVPLAAGDQVLGLLSLAESRRIRHLSADERARLDHLRELVTLAVQGAELVRRADERNRRLLGLLGSARSLAASLQVVQVAESTTEQALALLPGTDRKGELLLRQDDGSFARAVAGADGATETAAYEHARADALAMQAVTLRSTQQTREAEGRRRLVIPLLAEELLVGYLDLHITLPRSVRADEIELVQLLAAQAAVAVASARERRALEQRAATDPATDLYSGWYFYERLYSEAARSRRYQQPLSLVLARIDGYSGVIVEAGRPVATRVFAAVARIVKSSLRDKVDVACRWQDGGFALLLPNTAGVELGAGLVAERVRQTVEEMQFHDDDLGDLGRFTMSLGVAALPTHADDADELLAAAQGALRAARRAGQNKVEICRG